MVLYDISHTQHAQSVALDHTFQSAVLGEFQISVQYVNPLAVGITLLKVYVPVL